MSYLLPFHSAVSAFKAPRSHWGLHSVKPVPPSLRMLFSHNIFTSLYIYICLVSLAYGYALCQLSLKNYSTWTIGASLYLQRFQRTNAGNKYSNTWLQSLYEHAICVCRAAASVFFMTQSIHILKAGRDAHTRTYTNSHANARTYVHSSGLEAHIMVEIWRSQAQSSQCQQRWCCNRFTHPKCGRRRRGGLKIPVCGCSGDDTVIIIKSYFLLREQTRFYATA